ncbi:unnamed protein product, partial [Discosporangium mesarthrocarpum]
GGGGTEDEEVVFTTSPSTTLEEFINTKVEVLRWRVVKRWCRQILRGLCYLHRQPTPILHRKLCTGNVFINPSTSHIAVGSVQDLAVTDETAVTDSPAGTTAGVVGTAPAPPCPLDLGPAHRASSG